MFNLILLFPGNVPLRYNFKTFWIKVCELLITWYVWRLLMWWRKTLVCWRRNCVKVSPLTIRILLHLSRYLHKASKRSLKQLKTFQNHILVKYTHSYFILAQSFCLKFIGYSALTFPWKEPLITNVNFANYETNRCYFRILIWYTYLSSSCFDNRILFTWPFVFRVVFCNFIL